MNRRSMDCEDPHEDQRWLTDTFNDSSCPLVFVNSGKEYWPAFLLREGTPRSLVRYTDGQTGPGSTQDVDSVLSNSIVRDIPRRRKVINPKTFIEEQGKEFEASTSAKKARKARKVADGPKTPSAKSESRRSAEMIPEERNHDVHSPSVSIACRTPSRSPAPAGKRSNGDEKATATEDVKLHANTLEENPTQVRPGLTSTDGKLNSEYDDNSSFEDQETSSALSRPRKRGRGSTSSTSIFSASNTDSSTMLESNSDPPPHDESDDDSIEFLFSLPPETGMLVNTQQEVQNASSALASLPHDEAKSCLEGSDKARSCDTFQPDDPTTSKLDAHCQRQDISFGRDGGLNSLQPQNSDVPGEDQLDALVAELDLEAANSTSDPINTPYSLVSSAYVQNLAEICYIVNNDVRWRTGKVNDPLFRWEYGDDLNIVMALERLYEPRQVSKCPGPCQCILCRNEKDTYDVVGTDMSHDVPNGSTNTGAKKENAVERENTRSIYLLCRLFYRKGPWFRIDDIYRRYYAPRNDDTPKETKENDASSNTDKSLSSENLLEAHEQCIRDLVSDICLLKSAGHLRSFRDEEECGKVLDLSILSQKERMTVLSRLGAKNRKGSTGTQQPSERLIWKQMNKQQSIASHFSSRVDSNALLPVRKHVDQALVNQLVEIVVNSIHKHIDQPPHSLRKALRERLCKYIQNCVAKFVGPQQSLGFSCFRVCERPLRTLARYCRLFLCASAGPGNMRGGAEHGWYSIEDVNPVWHLPLRRIVLPPGSTMWHKIVYPGLSFRFGLSSAPCITSFNHIPACDKSASTGVPKSSVFSDVQSFRAWEASVELRANVDYLVELYERLRYEKKHRERASSTTLSAGHTFDSIDFLGVLTNQGRDEMIRKFDVKLSDELKQRILDDISESDDAFESECERVLGGIATIMMSILEIRHQTIGLAELEAVASRPWLRHLLWEGCLVYSLWDIIPFFERSGLHTLATRALQLLVFGRHVDVLEGDLAAIEPTPLAPLILSRRARGKALERLVIDATHIRRKEAQSRKKKLASDCTTRMCEKLLWVHTRSGSVSFSALRGLARRLKRPLSACLPAISFEATELGLRYENPSTSKSEGNRYVDWTPPTDYAVANAVVNEDKDSTGGRCAFVGFEEAGQGLTSASSLNVEELAMEFYRSGRLPSDKYNLQGGGWIGWHDEGAHLRALFRILCAAPLLGASWGCGELSEKVAAPDDLLYLSPYQSAPFDLHVGHIHSSTDLHRSFYGRRRDRINKMLSKLKQMGPQELCDLVYDSVIGKATWLKLSGQKDPSIAGDLSRIRSLSAFAAGLGGRQLASAFRCMFYDYRHYSGGVPDLSLFRARYVSSEQIGKEVMVDAGQWIGETFSPEYQEQLKLQRGMSMLLDKDEEFLGCDKVGDSGGSNRSNKSSSSRSSLEIPPLETVKKLNLVHMGRPVVVECLLVEVKSHNDRLDPRQEDWLNVLDIHGNARVCKFKDTSDKKKTAARKKE